MLTRKAIIQFFLLSLISHAIVLSIAGIIISGRDSYPVETFTVHLRDFTPKPLTVKEEKEEHKASQTPGPAKETGEKTEETIDLASTDSKYASYLYVLRKKIERQWTYPEDAFAGRQEGTTVLRFCIVSDGTLIGSEVLSSSGHKSLDRSAIAVIRAAAPYDALPVKFNLSKLHIVARFQYELVR
jgi:TonB family protein